MSTRKSSITAEIRLAGQQKFKSDMNEASRGARFFGKTMEGISSKGIGGGNFSGIRSKVSEVGKSYSGVIAVLKDLQDIAESPIKANAVYQDLKDQLTAVEGSVESASESLAFLRRVSRDQAMDFPSLVSAQKRLVSLGYSAEEARTMIRELANAAELSGEGVEIIDGIVGSLTNVSERGDASLKALLKLGDAMPSLRKLIGEEFGAKTAADLEKLDLTSRELFDGLSRGLQKLETAKASASESALDQDTSLVMGADETAADLPERKRLAEAEDERLKRVDELQNRSAARKAAAAEVELAKQIKIAELESELASAEAASDHDAVDSLTEEIALLNQKADLIERMGTTDAAAENFIRRKVALERESVNNARKLSEQAESQQKNGEFASSQSRNNRDLAEMEGEAGGMSKRRLDKLKKEGRVAGEAERLKSEGYSPADAEKLAERRVGAEDRISENQDRASRGLRPRIRSITDPEDQARNRYSRMSSRDKTGLDGLSHNEDGFATFQRKQAGGINAYGGDDPMALRPSESNLQRRPIVGVGNKGPRQTGDANRANSGTDGVGGQIIKELQALRAEVRNNRPGPNERSRPISTTAR